MRKCPKCDLNKTEALFDNKITYCKKCIIEVTSFKVTRGKKVKNYADYLEEDKKKKR